MASASLKSRIGAVCVRLVEEQDRGGFRTLDEQPVPVEHGLVVILGVADPLAFDFRDMDGQDAPPGLPGKLVNRLGLPGTRIAVEQAGESAPVAALLHPFPDFLVSAGCQERPELSHLRTVVIGVKEGFLHQGLRLRQPGDGRIVGLEVEIREEDLPGFRGQVYLGSIRHPVLADVLDEPSFHQVVVPFLQRGLGLVEIALVPEDILELPEHDPVIVLVDQVVADDDEDHPVAKVVDLQAFQLPDKTDLGIGFEEFLQLMVQFSGSDGVVVQVFVQVIQPVEEFVGGQAGLFRLLRDFIVLECPDATAAPPAAA